MCVCMCVEQVHILVHTYIHIYDFATHKCKYQLYVRLSVGLSALLHVRICNSHMKFTMVFLTLPSIYIAMTYVSLART